MYLDQHKYNVHRDPDAELRRIIERCLTHEDRKETLAKRIDIQKHREEIHQLRLALEAEEWSLELEDKLGNLRRLLSTLLLELSQRQVNGFARQGAIATSRNLQDHVWEAVTMAENGMTQKEQSQSQQETNQSAQEQEIKQREETKGKTRRQSLSSKTKKQKSD
ncbi:MAG: hypothetical protein HY711_10270 [Candidatus Melainabacteria bacterium]|nr:hypothetical protein [Candidatus Melainabacteria bacterium]